MVAEARGIVAIALITSVASVIVTRGAVTDSASDANVVEADVVSWGLPDQSGGGAVATARPNGTLYFHGLEIAERSGGCRRSGRGTSGACPPSIMFR